MENRDVNFGMGKAESHKETAARTRAKPAPQVKQPWLWNVVLLNDEEHTYDYVIHMMQSLFAMPKDKALRLAESVDKSGRAVCLTTHKEHAELKCEQILSFGRDPAMATCKGSMSAVIEPAEGGGEGDGTGEGGKA